MLAARLAAIAQARPTVFLFHIDDGRVRFDDKSAGYPLLPDETHLVALRYRGGLYARFLEEALAGLE